MANRPDITPLADELQRLLDIWRDRGESLEDIHAALDTKAGYVEALIEDSEPDEDDPSNE